MASVQKKLKGTTNVLAAFTIDNGMAIGKKQESGMYVDAVVYLQGNEDGTTTLYINEDKLAELNGVVVYKKFDENVA